MRDVHDDLGLPAALESALAACRDSLADYRSGLLTEEELREALLRHGHVRHGDDAWLLDLEAGDWLRWVRRNPAGDPLEEV